MQCCHAGATIDKEVDRLLQRIADGLLPDDRREGLAALRDLLTDVPQVRAPCSLHEQHLPGFAPGIGAVASSLPVAERNMIMLPAV